MRELLGEEAQQLEASLQKPPSVGLRVNTLKIAPPDFEELSPWLLEPVPWCPGGYLLPAGERPGLHPFHAAGLYYLQDPSAMAVAQALAPRPGARVLDLAAAPGGKSTHLASLLGGAGVLVANDASGPRSRELSRSLERWGVRNALVTSSEVSRLAHHLPRAFDAVLLDAPCSGEGMFRKSPAALAQWSPDLVSACAARQDELLQEAARLVRPGGRLAYSTCTFSAEENEEVLGRFLDSQPEWEAVQIGLPGLERSRPEWAAGARRAEEVAAAARLWPHRGPGEGHFVALLRRVEGDVQGGSSPPGSFEEGGLPRPEEGAGSRGFDGRRRSRTEAEGQGGPEARALWKGFLEAELQSDPVPRHLLEYRGDGLHAVPAGAPDLSGLDVLRPGLWLGSARRGRFIPSHSLALSLRAEEANLTLELGSEGAALDSYLAGAELESPGDDGWTLVTVAGFPLGWGRRARGIVKNHYPKGLRRRG